MNWNSIRTKLIVFLILPIILSLGAGMFISYSLTTQSVKERTVEQNKNLLYQGYRNIAGLLEELNRISLTAYSDSELYRMLNAGHDDVAANSTIYASLNSIYKSTPDIFQVYLFGVKDRQATLMTQTTPKRWQGAAPYVDAVPPEGQSVFLQSTHESHFYGLTSPIPEIKHEQVFTLHRRIERIPSNEPLGFLSIDVKLSSLQDIAEQLYDSRQEKLYVTDTVGNIIYSGQEEMIGRAMNEDWYGEQLEAFSQNEQGSFEINHSMFVYQRINQENADWLIIKEIPEKHLLQEANRSVMINLIMFGLALLVIIAATVLISIRVTAPIKRLADYMNEVKTGNLNVAVLPAGKDEIGMLTRRFRTMMETINDLILREYKLELSSKTSQLKALQAQINPHFLNNTLQIIGTLALELKVPQIYTLISALAKMMHYSMHNSDSTVTLKDELEHVKAYMELQKERFENRFSYASEVPDHLLHLKVPKLILQPIMENYFKHGLSVTETDGRIHLQASQGESYVFIVIENNGASIPPGQLEGLSLELQRQAEAEFDADTEADESVRNELIPATIGLHNVLARLRLVYGEAASLELENLEPVGVRIILKLPV
ncbi:cache domain-containing sensor histidine kinase [Paenibacillus antibioticophila]|uniref:cache domain-containing sensor histidine kinase n=1 Tax=Paenibacillus antibioticophila TaxID=1274374 RepID=UPI0005C85628|nr:sensor histidine kinase [Paenibacillus antibioticophila]